jgi:AP-1 complex subunit mu
MAAHAVYILDQKGKVIISRNYRGDLPSNVPQRFMGKLLTEEEEETHARPFVEDEELNYVYITHNNLRIMAVTDGNANACMILLFLYKLVEVFQEYFKELEEESLRDNFVITYELLDEMMDFGYPQTTESKVLQEYITQQSHKLTKQQVILPPEATGVTPWRSGKEFYRKNEVFLDVIEKINLLVASNGTLLRSEIQGSIKMRVQLSGMPDLRLGLNDRAIGLEHGTGKNTKGKSVEMEDVAFHQCVKLAQYESNRTISFVPPDGDFELMSYRLNTNVKPLIWVEAIIESHKGSRVEYLVKARSQFKQRASANNVQIWVPVPKDADTPKFKASIGSVKYVPEKDAILWSIKQFPGSKEFLLRAHFGLPSISDETQARAKQPITVNFEIPYFAVSGLQVRYLKVIEKSGYQALPWVRYITQSGDYQIKVNV